MPALMFCLLFLLKVPSPNITVYLKSVMLSHCISSMKPINTSLGLPMCHVTLLGRNSHATLIHFET